MYVFRSSVLNIDSGAPWSLKFSGRKAEQTFTCVLLCLGLFMVQPTNDFDESIWCLWRNELTVVIFCLFNHVLSIKTAFNLVKLHLLFRVMLLNQWSVDMSYVVGHAFIVFGGDWIYNLSVIWIYADIHYWRTYGKLCNKLNPKFIYIF